MTRRRIFEIFLPVFISWLLPVACRAESEEKVLMYDENKGMIFVDKDEKSAANGKSGKPATKRTTGQRSSVQSQRKTTPNKTANEMHPGLQKDPPDLYFKSGLVYFKNGDYVNALKNFSYAHSVDPQPQFLLWTGKAYRQLKQYDRMLAIMNEIRSKYSTSDVADDALFETAVYYQQNDDYDSADMKFAELAEQYPFGTSFANSEEYLELSRKQRQVMRAEIVSALKVLGFDGQTVSDAVRKFQLKNSLPADGRSTRPTIRMIKANYRQKNEHDTQMNEQHERIRQGIIAAFVTSIVLVTNLWVLMITRKKLRQRKRQLVNLQKVLSDLDIKKL